MRTRKVTRTIISTDCEVMTANTSTQEFGSIVITVAGTYDLEDEKSKMALEKAVKKSFVNQGLGADVVMLSIQATTPVKKHYTMLEDDFIKLAECEVLAQGEDVNEDEDEDEDEEDEE